MSESSSNVTEPEPPNKVAPGQVDIHFNEEEAEQSVFPIQWCLTRDLNAWMIENGVWAKNPHLLVVYMQNQRELRGSRQLLPLDAQMTYLSFNRAGDHEIHAAVVWDDTGNVLRLKQRYLGRAGYDYSYAIFDYEGTWLGKIPNQVGHSVTTVSIDEKLFARKPSTALAWFGNHLFQSFGPPRDQCAFRKRFLFALVAMPVYLLIRVPIECAMRLLVWLLGMMLGLRYLNHKALLPLGPYTIPEIYNTPKWSERAHWLNRHSYRSISSLDKIQPERSFFAYTYNENAKEYDGLKSRPLWFMSLTPIFLLVVFGVSFLFCGIASEVQLLDDKGKAIGTEIFPGGYSWALVRSALIALLFPPTLMMIELLIRGISSLVKKYWPSIKSAGLALWQKAGPVMMPPTIIIFGLILALIRYSSKAIAYCAIKAWQLFRTSSSGQRMIRWYMWRQEIKGRRYVVQIPTLEPKPIQASLVCDGAIRKVGLGTLPRSKRTLRLRFLDLKAKVCRPFAQ